MSEGNVVCGIVLCSASAAGREVDKSFVGRHEQVKGLKVGCPYEALDVIWMTS